MEEHASRKTHTAVQKEPVKTPSPTHPIIPLDSLESDTESLAQEKAYQQELKGQQGHYGKATGGMRNQEIRDSLQMRTGRRSEVKDEDNNHDIMVHNSLEVAAVDRLEWSSPTGRAQNDYEEISGTEETRDLASADAYSDLRYDPNWRTKLEGAARFEESPRPSLAQYQLSSLDSPGEREELVIKGGYRYIVVASPPVPDARHASGAEGPYHLHSQHAPASGGASGTSALPLQGHSNWTQDGWSHDYTVENNGVSSQPDENLPEMNGRSEKGYHSNYKQQYGRTQRGASKNISKDIVERNKITLGRNTTKCGSYLKAHAPKQETAETDSQISKEKLQQRGKPKPITPPGSRAQDTPGDCLCPPGARPLARIEPNHRKMPSPASVSIGDSRSQPSSSPIQLGCGRTASVCLPQPTLAQCYSCYWNPETSPLPALPGYNQPKQGIPPQGFRDKLTADPDHCQPGRGPRAQPPTRPLSRKKYRQNHNPNEVDGCQFSDNSPRPDRSGQPQRSGSYSVLPPIGEPVTEAEHTQSPPAGQGVRSMSPLRRSGSNGYRAQMERQKQLKEQVSYKSQVYTLRDYKQLKQVVNLGGLGPDYKASEKTAENTRRQRLYSNLIWEQNKKTSTIPFLQPKDPEGCKKMVPRRKALEYAKNITKPKPKPHPKKHQDQPEGCSDHVAYLGPSLPTALDQMIRRHEEEKLAATRFQKVPVV